MFMKREVRILGVDDASFKREDKEVLVVGTVFRGGEWMDGVLSTYVDVDGDDATDKLVEMIVDSKFYSQIQCIMLDGIALGGFNVVDIHKLYEKTEIPVIVIIRNFPHEMINAVDGERKKLLEKAGEVYEVNEIFMQVCGLELEKAKVFVRLSSTRSNIPEPVRIAHLIGRGIVKGES